MTSFISWIGVDARSPASIYMASDSRISWSGENSVSKWDYGCKLFASQKHPDIFGYVGDVLYPSQILGQALGLVDSGMLFSSADSPSDKFERLSTIVQAGFSDYPIQQKRQFTITYCTREKEGMESKFWMFLLMWNPIDGWKRVQPDLPDQSGVIEFAGSGIKTLKKWNVFWNQTKQGGTSRAVFGAFCDSLMSAEDPQSGGAPQLVGIYRKGCAKAFGVIYKSKRFFSGVCVDKLAELDTVEWRNSVFERCDGKTLARLDEAQMHSRPRGLAKSL
jgi:hypothetical protein